MGEAAVHKDFADWYRVVSVEPQPEVLQRRWQGVEAFTKESRASDIPDLARVFYGLKPRSGDFLDRFRKAFKTVDESFPMRSNDAELRILAGSSLLHSLRYPDGRNYAATLAVVVGECRGHRKPPVRDIASLARDYLTKASAALRGHGKLPAPAAVDFAPMLAELKAALQTNEPPKLNEPLSTTLKAVTEGVQHLTKWAALASDREELRKEESDVLWWLFGGHSRDLGVPFHQLPQLSAILVSAKELSDLTRAMPGPFSARAFLGTVIRTAHPDLSGKDSVADAVAACPLPWQEQFVAIAGLGRVDDLCPIHAAVAKSVEAGGKKGWQAAYGALTGLKDTARFDPLDMAVQAYEERLLIRTVDLLNAG